MDFSAVEDCLNQAASAGIRPGLERIRRTLERLGNPQDDWPAFHVVGTNGKGSTCAFLDSVLRAAGYRTALYTSPHLESPAERLLIDGRPLGADAWLEAVRDAASVSADDPPSYFELATAAAFLLASRAKVDAAVVEAGLGGRLDATNLLRPENTLCSVVASVSMDHMEFLGDTLEAIAGEKFAVVKPGAPACFLGDNPSLIPLFERFCGRNGARPFVVSRDARLENVRVTEEGNSFDFRSPDLNLDGVRTRMVGRYQLSNAALALSALGLARSANPERLARITPAAILRGMEAARWPGRMEVWSRKTKQRACPRPLIVLDGGHNRDGVARLVESVRELWPGRRVGVVYAAMRDKDYAGCLELLSTLKPALYPTAVPGMARCLSAGELLAAAEAGTGGKSPVWRNRLEAFDNPLDALCAATEERGNGEGRNELVMVCGSLYLIGWLKRNYPRGSEGGGEGSGL